MTSDLAQTSRLGRAIAVAAIAAGSALAAAPAQAAEDLIVKYDQSQLLRLPRPAAEIIVGNPSIADVSVQSGNLLVVTGKTFGITNIIALDADRNVIQDQRVLVKRDEGKVVNLLRGTIASPTTARPSATPRSPSATSRSTSTRSEGLAEQDRLLRKAPATRASSQANSGANSSDGRAAAPLIPISLPKCKTRAGIYDPFSTRPAYCTSPESRA